MAAVAPVLLPEMKRRGNHEGDRSSPLLAASGRWPRRSRPPLVLITIGSVAGISICGSVHRRHPPGVVLAVLLADAGALSQRRDRNGPQSAPR